MYSGTHTAQFLVCFKAEAREGHSLSHIKVWCLYTSGALNNWSVCKGRGSWLVLLSCQTSACCPSLVGCVKYLYLTRSRRYTLATLGYSWGKNTDSVQLWMTRTGLLSEGTMHKYWELSGKTEPQKGRKKPQHRNMYDERSTKVKCKRLCHSTAPEDYMLVFKYTYMHMWIPLCKHIQIGTGSGKNGKSKSIHPHHHFCFCWL